LLYRFSAFANLAGIVMGMSGLLAVVRNGRTSRRRLWPAILTVAVSLAVMIMVGTARLQVAAAIALLSIAMVTMQHAPRLAGFVPALAMSGLCMIAVSEFQRNRFHVGPTDRTRAGLYEWIVRNSDPNTVFAVPPDWKDFRLCARRATIVDWAAVPLDAGEAMEWKARMQHVTGVQSMASLSALLAGYANLDVARAEALYREYGVRYFASRADEKLGIPGRLLYRDDFAQLVEFVGAQHGRTPALVGIGPTLVQSNPAP
jgi:hypothetical protein